MTSEDVVKTIDLKSNPKIRTKNGSNAPNTPEKSANSS